MDSVYRNTDDDCKRRLQWNHRNANLGWVRPASNFSATSSGSVGQIFLSRIARVTLRTKKSYDYLRHSLYSSYICVCVFFPSILDIKFVGRTSRGHTGGRSHRIFNPPSFCGACLDFCREKDSAIPFPRRP